MPPPSVPYQVSCMNDTCGIFEANPPGQPSATVVFTCSSADHYTLIKDLLGYPVAAGYTILRTYPFQYPPSPNLIATSIESVEFYGNWTPVPGVGLPWLWRSHCKVTCRFELPLWFQGAGDPSGQPYTTTTFAGSTDVLTLPETTYAFPVTSAKTNTPIGIKIPKVDITMLRHMMPYPPVPQAFPLLGCVNDAPITIGGFACATGTVLFLGFSTQPSADPLGNIYWDTQYQLSFKDRPWNQFLSPDPSQGWAEPVDGNGDPVFPSGNLANLP